MRRLGTRGGGGDGEPDSVGDGERSRQTEDTPALSWRGGNREGRGREGRARMPSYTTLGATGSCAFSGTHSHAHANAHLIHPTHTHVNLQPCAFTYTRKPCETTLRPILPQNKTESVSNTVTKGTGGAASITSSAAKRWTTVAGAALSLALPFDKLFLRCVSVGGGRWARVSMCALTLSAVTGLPPSVLLPLVGVPVLAVCVALTLPGRCFPLLSRRPGGNATPLTLSLSLPTAPCTAATTTAVIPSPSDAPVLCGMTWTAPSLAPTVSAPCCHTCTA